jgi:hypothetical protein
MNYFRKALAVVLVLLVSQMGVPVQAATANTGYKVKDAGGSIGAKTGDELHLMVTSEMITISSKTSEVLIAFKPDAVTDLSFGQEVHHRIGTAAALAVVSLGVGALVAFSKSKKDFIGITWDDSGKKGGLVFQADKNEYRGIIASLEGVTGKKAVNTDTDNKKK